VAEQYIPGKRKIFYKAWNFGDVEVKVDLYDSELNDHKTCKPLEEVVNINEKLKGIYYFEHDFQEGVYIAYFYERKKESGSEWEERGIQVYNIKRESRGDKGPGVIGI